MSTIGCLCGQMLLANTALLRRFHGESFDSDEKGHEVYMYYTFCVTNTSIVFNPMNDLTFKEMYIRFSIDFDNLIFRYVLASLESFWDV